MIQKYGLYIVWVIACLASFASLYFDLSSLLDWWQRVCLFPFVFIVGIAAWRGFLGIASYLLPQTFIGLLFAFYQFLIAKRPSLSLPFLSEELSRSPWIAFSATLLFLCLFILLSLLSKRHTRRMVL